MAESMWQGCGGGGAGARSRGFTLMELLITVGILAILAAIAIPSYSAYVVRGQRASAKVVLLQTAQSLERYYTANGAYLTNAGALPLAPVGGTATCLALAPVDAGISTYCVTGAASATGGFTLSATPCGDAAGLCPASANNSYTDSGCDVLTIDNSGLKGIAGSPSLSSDECWQH